MKSKIRFDSTEILLYFTKTKISDINFVSKYRLRLTQILFLENLRSVNDNASVTADKERTQPVQAAKNLAR